MKKNEPQFSWDELTGTTICVLKDCATGKEYVGTATCHPDDMDMCSRRTGETIAFTRATIEVYKELRDSVNYELKALNQLYYSMNKSKKFNPSSYEAKMLYSQISHKKEDLLLAKDLLERARMELRSFINDKNTFFKKIRLQRQNKELKILRNIPIDDELAFDYNPQEGQE